MSESSRRTTHSRRTRHASSIDVAVTEASFQSLALSPSPANQQYPASISPYQATDQQHRRAPYNRSDSNTAYLQPAYGSTTFTAAPSSRFAIVSPRDHHPAIRSPSYPIPGTPSQAQTMPAPDMSTYTYMQPSLSGGATGSGYSTSGYYSANGSGNRSMFTLFSPQHPSHLRKPLNVEESEVARQRRRTSQETRRQSKLRVRNNKLSAITHPVLDSLQATDSSIDSSPTAPSMNTYVNDPNEKMYINPSYVRGGYNDVVSGSPAYSQRPHESQYPMGHNLSHNTYSPLPPTYTIDPRRPGPMSAPMHTEPVPVGDRREKPRCYDHGCNGREFSTFSNLLRHQREKSGTAAKSHCPNCGAEFTRTTARNGHMEHGKCKPRRTSDA